MRCAQPRRRLGAILADRWPLVSAKRTALDDGFGSEADFGLIHLSGLAMRLLLLVSLFFLGQASAADLRILSAGAVESGLHPVLAAFEKSTGHHVTVTFNTTPHIPNRGASGTECGIASPAS